jgi:hypothetical protein
VQLVAGVQYTNPSEEASSPPTGLAEPAACPVCLGNNHVNMKLPQVCVFKCVIVKNMHHTEKSSVSYQSDVGNGRKLFLRVKSQISSSIEIEILLWSDNCYRKS